MLGVTLSLSRRKKFLLQFQKYRQRHKFLTWRHKQMKLKIELTVEEINQVLQTLDQMPYRQVVTLIENIKQQALSQMEPEIGKPDPT